LFALAWRGRGALVATDRVALAQLVSCAGAIPICAYLMMAPYWAIYSWRSGVHLPTGVDEQGRPWVGAENPKVVVHEYVDYSCPHCALAASHSRRLLASYPGTLRVVRHQFPRMRCLKTPELVHCLYTRAALCAGDQGAFWQADSWLFEHASGRLSVDLHKAAADLHLDYGKLTSCMESQRTFDRASAEMADATAHHIIDAPSYVIDGKRYVGGEAFVALKKLL
jgi:protein-disulfide isomerase